MHERHPIDWCSARRSSGPVPKGCKPRLLGYPFALWTLARLQQALQERHGLQVTPATIWKWLQAEGLHWKRQQSWFQVTVDAAFAEKRGPSSRPTRSRGQRGGSLASTNSGL